MAKPLRYALLSVRELLTSATPFVLLAAALLTLAYLWLNPVPPRQVTLATGPAQSAYDEFGKRYASTLATYGISVKLVESEGAAQNLQWLTEGKVDLGFVQGGSSDPTSEEQQRLLSLGSLFVEPLWLFYRSKTPLNSLPEFQYLRLNVGTTGSGVPRLMSQLFELNHMDEGKLQLSRLSQTPATVAFLDKQLDALLFASAPESPMVQMLLQTPGVRLLNFAQSEAYSRRFSFLTPITLPRGVVDLAKDIPAQDVRLVATTTTLLANPKVHPAILQLFSQTALSLHGQAGWFSRAHEFPNIAHTEFAVSDEAQRAIKSGVPLLQRYLPFAYANLIERMWLALGIILAILLPLSRIVPPLYEFRIRSRVFRWYGQLRSIEDRASAPSRSLPDLLEELRQLEDKVEKISVPLSYTDELYALRNHIELVRQKLIKA
ncbi:TAXI family TRAP transporter solute-binding subunit [Rhodoferax sp.]|uniref:TAXI family TRAP transporter solute-binding subunit n=1 Tax=Rhodoferax sp. TaxID=50421 RepID=UPI0026172287|nr:TAXI family TRAP transporter solute-binding subunit [Rhodoferax sp.]MDD2924255.1 TAXI family TRAP transporter solute-binding subunit [Rhodoferax sp.]